MNDDVLIWRVIKCQLFINLVFSIVFSKWHLFCQRNGHEPHRVKHIEISWMLTTLGRCCHFHNLQFTTFLNLTITTSHSSANPIALKMRKIEQHIVFINCNLWGYTWVLRWRHMTKIVREKDPSCRGNAESISVNQVPFSVDWFLMFA